MKQLLITIIIILIISIFPLHRMLDNHGFLIIILFLIAVATIIIVFMDWKKKH